MCGQVLTFCHSYNRQSVRVFVFVARLLTALLSFCQSNRKSIEVRCGFNSQAKALFFANKNLCSFQSEDKKNKNNRNCIDNFVENEQIMED
jgi:hypothetical protein